MALQPWEVPDELWDRIEQLIPRKVRRFRYPGRRPLDDRRVLSGVLLVLATGVGWERLPKELGFGSGMTCWRRLHELLLAELRAADKLGSRAVVDASYIQAKKGAPRPPEPGRQGRSGSKYHLLTDDGGGVPLAWSVTGANRNEGT